MEAEWREEREHRLQKKNTTDAGERDGGMGSGKKTPDLAVLGRRERRHTGTLTTDRNTGGHADGP